MNVHLIVPELFWPHEETAARRAGELDLPGLETLLARGRRARGKAPHLEGWLCEQFGVARQQDWPVAPFALLADGGKPGDHYWLRADPAHLDVATDQLVLAASAISVTPQEAEALVAALNHHFDADAMTFHAIQPDRWYVRLTRAPELATTPIAAAHGRAIDPLLPSGLEAKQWHAHLNEMQMVLHEHPVNEAREARGEAAINSLWLWGGGHLQVPVRRPFARLRSSDSFVAGLAQAAGGTSLPSLPSAQAWLAASASEGIEAIVLDALRIPAGTENEASWREQLQGLEWHWFEPLLNALREGRIGMITLHAIGGAGVLDAETTRQDLRYFWRRRRPLRAWA